jgi:hypothetical protein
VTRSERLGATLVAALFIALHLPFLATSLEDLDSINFALGIRDFDVAHHQPHPPGYPIYIALAKIVHLLITSEARVLAVLGIVAGGVAVFALLALYAQLDRDRPRASMTWLAVIVTLLGPLFWLTAERPLSDVVGLTAALAVQAAILAAPTPGAIATAAAAAGFAAGIRSQVVWLTVPLLLYHSWQIRAALRPRHYATIVLAFAAGALAWFVPLIVVSGGPITYWHALFSQGAEDLSGVKMLATTPTVRQLAAVLQYTLIEPWGSLAAGLVLIALSLAGLAERVRFAPRALLILAIAFGPYAIFDVLFQESITTRYALPLMIPMAYLAVRGCAWIGEGGGIAAAVGLALFCAWTDDLAMYQYSRMDAPAFRMLADMALEKPTAEGDAAPVLAMHRREDLDMRRPIVWAGLPRIGERLPAPAKHEWLEAVKYWNRGGRAPVWYVADPLRSDLALIGTRARPKQYRWALRMTGLIGGVRPNVMDWYTITPPDWYLGEGWAVTPETGGVAREDGRGSAAAPISGWIRRWPQPTTLMIGGRNLGTLNKPARVRVAVDAVAVDDLTVAPGSFLRMITVPPSSSADDYAPVTVASDNPDLALEQFDAQPAGRIVFGFDQGWYEREYDPATGALWRWASDRAVIRVRSEGHALALTLRGEIEHASSSRVTVRSGERVLAQFEVGESFARTVILPADAFGQLETTIALESSVSFVPAETRWRSRDRRRLALKLYECTLTPVS